MRAINLAIVFALAAQSFTLQNASFADSADDLNVQPLKRGEAAAAVGDWRSAAENFVEASHAPESKPIALYDLGIAYYHLGMFPEALAAERQVVAIDDTYVPAFVQIATILSRTGDAAGAQAALKKALEIEPGSAIAQANLAKIQAQAQSQKNAPIAAVKIFDGSQPQSKQTNEDKPIEIVIPSDRTKEAPTQGTLSPAAVDANAQERTSTVVQTESKSEQSTTAKVEVKSEQPGSVIAKAEASSSEPAASPAANPVAATVSTKSEETTVAIQPAATTPEAAVGEVPIITVKPATVAANSSDVKPADSAVAEKPGPLSSLSDLLNSDKAEVKAAAPAETVVQSKTAPVVKRSAAKQQRAADLVTEALVYFNAGAVDFARHSLELAVEADPGNAVAHADLGVVLGTQGDFEGQITQERAALKIEPKNAEAHLDLAWALAREKSWNDAVTEYNAALAIDQSLTEALSGKAFVLSKLGSDDEAVSLLIDAKDKNKTAAWPCVALSTLYLDQNKNDAAAAELKEALAREPGNVEALKRTAQLNLATSDWKAAVEHYRLALKKQPFDLDAYLGLALAQQKNHDNEGALKSLKMAVEIAPSNATAHASLSNILEKLGRAQEAESEARMSLQLDPKQQVAQAVLHRVTQ